MPAILAVAGAYNNKHPDTQLSCRVDRAGLISAAPWIKVPYPFQWGCPTFDAGDVFSTGTIIAVSRYGSATPLPPSVLSRGIGWLVGHNQLVSQMDTLLQCKKNKLFEVVLLLLKGGLFNENVMVYDPYGRIPCENAVIVLTLLQLIFNRKIRDCSCFPYHCQLWRLFTVSSLPMRLCSIVLLSTSLQGNHFNRLLTLIVCGRSSFCWSGISPVLQLNSFRTKFILGFSLFLGLPVPQYFKDYILVSGRGPVHTGATWLCMLELHLIL
ncbi:hypothetical protein POTOM_002267 [Populus tomentosa]|uniref:Uncharacterized protein n=1 Tax=Populus tomentosa TaxID=118781 RepID=A0A8X8IZ12_POPTO|nr:hypothetical protein POTOM_002267 [Populus tomentosa]